MLERVVKYEKLVFLPIVGVIANADKDVFVVDVVDVVKNSKRHSQRSKMLTRGLLLVEDGDSNRADVLECLMVLGHVHGTRNVLPVPLKENHAALLFFHLGLKHSNKIPVGCGDDQRLNFRSVAFG